MSEVKFSPGIVPGSTLSFPAGQTAPTVKQNDTTTGNGATLTIQAQTTSAATSVGGKLVLKSGTGTVATGGQQAHGEIELTAGSVNIGTYLTRVGGDTRFTLNSGLPYCVFAANGASQFWDFQATDVGGQIFFDSRNVLFRPYADTTVQNINRSVKLNTTDATQTTLSSYTLLNNSCVQVEARINARDATNGVHATYILRASAKRHSSGAATLIGTVDQVAVKEEASAASWDATLDVSSNDIRIRVTGSAATTITWACDFKIFALTP